MSDVPDELLRDILLRLPAAPLLRFRCVSKSWKCLIDDHEFIEHHLYRSRNTNSNINIVLRSNQLYSADFDLLDETNMTTFKQLPHPLKTASKVTEILGSCDGLLALRNQQYDITTLWNPSVRRFHVIPRIGDERLRDFMEFFCGFGYDVVSDDYKFIRIFQFRRGGNFISVVMVYSLKSDSWRRLPDFPYVIKSSDEKNYGVLANGALHCTVSGKVSSDDYEYSVVAIDLGTEEYRLVPLPNFADDDAITSFDVAVLGGCLSLMCNVNEDHVDVWIMKEYGVQDSWSILFSYDTHGYDFMKWPLAYSKCGRKVLVISYDNVLRWYDLDKKSIDVPMVQMPSKKSYEIYTCLQSFVLLNNGAHDLDLVAKTKQKWKENKKSSKKRKSSLA